MRHDGMRGKRGRFTGTLAVATVLAFGGTASAATLAITEFMNNPDGQDDGREWVEIYNYGNAPIDLTGYTLSDEDSDSYTFGSVSVAALDFLIVVNAGSLTAVQAKAIFEEGWLGGNADSRVVGADLGAIANGGDELVLADASSVTVWSLAYTNDEDEDSTVLTDGTFGTSSFGSKAAPGIDRDGDDNGVADFLGYEDSGGFSGVVFEDAAAINSASFLAGIGVATDFYDSVDPETTEGDPLALTVVPEPATWVLAAIGLLCCACRLRL